MANVYGTQNNDTIRPTFVSAGVVGRPTQQRDVIFGYAGIDFIDAAGGDDSIYAGSGNDTIHAGYGNDFIDGQSGADRMIGGAGNDTYIVDDVGDTIFEYAGGGIDRVETAMSYSLEGNPYVENLTLLGAISFGYGNDANNMIDARFARRLPSGTSVDLRGRGGNDTIQGVDSFGTSDRIYGGDQSDWLYGNAGHDRLYGENHMDFLSGGDDNDYLVGGGGTDTLRGDRGNDTLIGNSNAAVSTQGPEFDALWGGPGQDRFVLGNFFGAFYQDAGYATLKDFDRFADTIQLGVFRSFYSLREGQFTGLGNPDTEILYNGNRIALVDGQVGLSLNANYFDFV
ncbi:MAG: hypothetical protein AAFW84_07630 [Cyanobacteria bacterium J06635_15]